MSAVVDRQCIYNAVCACGWEGGNTFSPTDAQIDADRHNREGCRA